MKHKGFTLIELSIVLVIIGLIVGGVLVGQDLINAAKLRAQVSQLERYSTALNTFKLKYNAIPGDMLDADDFGFPYTTSGTLANRGDKRLNSHSAPTPPYNQLWVEGYYVFIHLASAGLVDDTFALQGATYNFCDSASYSKQFATMEAGKGGIYATTYKGGIWWGLMFNFCALGTGENTVAQLSTGGVLKPIDAYGIDQKIDDGVPGTGSVIAVTDYLGAIDANVAQCVTDGTSTAYNVTDGDLECRLWVKAQ